MKKIYVCKRCGSPRVTVDALVDPNKSYEVVSVLDDEDCGDCEERCRTEEVEVADDFNLETDFYKRSE